MKEHQLSAQCEVYMIEQELTEEEPTVLQTIESAEDGGNDVALEAADAPQSTSDTEDQEMATIELTEESLATLSTLANGQQLFVRRVEGTGDQYAILTTRENGEQEVTYLPEDALAALQLEKSNEEDVGKAPVEEPQEIQSVESGEAQITEELQQEATFGAILLSSECQRDQNHLQTPPC